MNLVNEFSQILIHFLYGEETLEAYQQSIIEFVSVALCLVVAFLFVRFVLKVFSGIFVRF